MDKSLQKKKAEDPGLSVTALYTAQTWAWARFDGADIFASEQSRIVFNVTNFFLTIAKVFNWRLRSLKKSLVHRHALIDSLLSQLMPDGVLEIAAGLSRRGYSMSRDKNLTYIEVDTLEVVSQKKSLLDKFDGLQERTNWSLVAGDAMDFDYRETVKRWRRPAIVAEGLLMYLDAPQQRWLMAEIASALADKGAGAFIFDLVPQSEQPKPGVFGRILEFLMKRFTGGRSFVRDKRGRDDIQRELTSAGFSRVDVLEPYRVAQLYGLPFPGYKSQQLVFLCQMDGNESQ